VSDTVWLPSESRSSSRRGGGSARRSSKVRIWTRHSSATSPVGRRAQLKARR
jgi:hypothetical protein